MGTIDRLVTVILLLFGAPFACLGLYEAAEVQGAINSGGQAQGTVVDNSYQTTQDGTTISGAYYPVVEFSTGEGQTVRFTDGIGSLPPDYEVGATVRVLYDPAEPQAARLWSWKRLWFAPTLFLAIGLLPVGVFALWQISVRLAARRGGLPPGR